MLLATGKTPLRLLLGSMRTAPHHQPEGVIMLWTILIILAIIALAIFIFSRVRGGRV